MNRNVKKESKIRFQERSPRHCAKQGAKGILQEELKASCKRKVKEPNKASCSRSQRHPAKTRTFGAAVQRDFPHMTARARKMLYCRISQRKFEINYVNFLLPRLRKCNFTLDEANNFLMNVCKHNWDCHPKPKFFTFWAALIAVFKLLLNSTTLAPNPISSALPLISIAIGFSKRR